MRAISRMPSRLMPHSLITMATPFIVTEKRVVPEGERLAMEGASAVGTIAGVIGAAIAVIYALRLLIPEAIREAVMPLLRENETIFNFIFAALVLLVATSASKVVGKISRARNRLVRLARGMSVTRIGPCKVLVLRAPGDEASLALSVGDTVEWAHSVARAVFAVPAYAVRSWLGNRIIGTITHILFNIVVAAGALTVAYTLFVSGWIEHRDPMNTVAIVFMAGTVALLAPFAIGLATFLLTGLVASASMLLSSLLSFGHGIEYPLIGWTSRTTVESSPLGIRVATQSLRVHFRSGLRHGIYRHAATRRAIVDWIEEVVQRSKVPP